MLKGVGKVLEIELYITTSHDCVDNLFDFRSKRETESKAFKATVVYLPLPKQKPIFYFFHGHKTNTHKLIEIQRRNQCISDISSLTNELLQYRLLGGVQISTDQSNHVVVQPIAATDISRIRRDNSQQHQQAISCFKPHMVVRTFSEGYPLRPKQTLKIGNIGLSVAEVSQQKYSFEQMLRQGEVLELEEDDQEKTASDDWQNQNMQIHQDLVQIGEKQCRLCFQSEENDQDFLFAACNCKGTSQFVHLSCLRKWVQQKTKQIKREQAHYVNSQLSPKCEICRRQYPKVVMKSNIKYAILDIFEDSQSFVALHHIYDSGWRSPISQYVIGLDKGKSARIGRTQGNTVELNEVTVSRQHAEIYLSEGNEVLIKDICSKYGTLVHDPKAQFRLRSRFRAFQIQNVVFAMKLTQQRQHDRRFYI